MNTVWCMSGSVSSSITGVGVEERCVPGHAHGEVADGQRDVTERGEGGHGGCSSCCRRASAAVGTRRSALVRRVLLSVRARRRRITMAEAPGALTGAPDRRALRSGPSRGSARSDRLLVARDHGAIGAILRAMSARPSLRPAPVRVAPWVALVASVALGPAGRPRPGPQPVDLEHPWRRRSLPGRRRAGHRSTRRSSPRRSPASRPAPPPARRRRRRRPRAGVAAGPRRRSREPGRRAGRSASTGGGPASSARPGARVHHEPLSSIRRR